MDGYLAHGNFKYIDKHRSKTGKWVYTYKDAAGKKAKQAFNAVGLGGNTSGGVQIRPNKQGSRHVFKDRKVSSKVKRATTALEKLNDKYGPKVTAISKSFGSGSNRTRYEETKKNLFGGRVVSKRKYDTYETSRNMQWTNDVNKDISERHFKERNSASKAKKWLMDVNDKYGPKQMVTIKSSSAYNNGKSKVYKIQKNLFGGREQFAYAYTVEEKPPRKKNKT